MPDPLQDLLTHARDMWGKLPRQAQIIIPIVAVVILGGLVGLSVWSGGDEWIELCSGLNSSDLMDTQAYIEQHHRVTPRIDYTTGTVVVPANIAPVLRMQLIYNDVIMRDSASLLDADNKSMLATPEQALERRQLAAEKKLQNSIESLRPVYRASVNLTMAKIGVFLGDDQPAKAAVNLKLHSGEKLASQQIDAIYKLIVHSVAGLSRENVTVLDAQGNLLLGDSSSHSQMESTISNWEYQQQQAKDLERRIKEVLAPVVGNEQDIRVGIHVESDFDKKELTKRTYVNEDSVLLQEEETDETAQGDIQNGLPPGTASNVAASANLTGGTGGQPVVINRTETKKDYQPSLEETTTITAAGGIKRVTAAVNINEVKQWTAAEITQFEELVKTAIGFDQQRGDLVTVSSFAFMAPSTGPSSSMLDRVLVYLPDIAKYGVIGLLGFMLLMLFRSVMGTLHIGESVEPEALAGEQPMALGMESEQEALTEEERAQMQDGGSNTTAGQENLADIDFETAVSPGQIEIQGLQNMVERMVEEDPDVILRVIEGWISEDRDDFDIINDDEE